MWSRTSTAKVAIAATVALSMAVSACGSDTSPDADVNGLTPVKVAVSPGAATSTPLYLAESKGVFAAHGLAVEFSVVDDGSVAIPNTLNGQIQFSVSGFGPAVQAIERGVPVSIIGAANIVPTQPDSQYQAVVVNNESGIENGAQIKTWAADSTEVDPSQAFTVDALGGDYASLKRVAVPFPAVGDAVADGTVDAALLNEPFLTAALGTGKVKVLQYVNGELTLPGAPGAVFIASDKYVEMNPEVTKSFVESAREAYSYAAQHREEVAQFVPQTGLSDEVPPVTALGEYQDGPLDTAAVQKLVDVFVQYGAIKGDVSAQDMIYTP